MPDRPIYVRIDDKALKRIDNIRKNSKEIPTRSQVIRELINVGLDIKEKGFPRQ